MGADCPVMEPWRPTPLSIAQDSSCVTWDKLVALRLLYNKIWDQLDACGLAEGSKYGEASLHNLQEISPLPTIEGFLRLEVETALSGGEYISTPGETVFILTGGTLSSLLNNDSYTYLDTTFHALLKDSCNSCSKFFPKDKASAEVSINCPAGESQPLYEGLYSMDLNPSPEACGINVDWGESTGILEGHVDFFDSSKEEGDCYETRSSCCELFDTAHYEAVSVDDESILLLKYIDIFVKSDGVSAGMAGYLTTLVTASDLQDIVDRVTSDLSHFAINANYLCDRCGISGGNKLEESCTGKTAINCTAALSWFSLIRTSAVAGYGPHPPKGYPNGCYACSVIATGAEGFETDEVICACDWEQLAGVMSFIIDHGCVLGCSGGSAKCPSEREVKVAITTRSSTANASNCGIFNSDDGHYYKKKVISHTNLDCHCFNGTPFNCDFTETTEQRGGRTAECATSGYCDDPVNTVSPKTYGQCVKDACGVNFNETCSQQVVTTAWTDQITKAEVVAKAEGLLGGDGTCSSTTHEEPGDTDFIKCRISQRIPGYTGVALDNLSGYAERSEYEQSCHIVNAVLTVQLTGADAGVDALTLSWDETVTPTGGAASTTTQSEPFSSGSAYLITINVDADDQTTKLVNHFKIS